MATQAAPAVNDASASGSDSEGVCVLKKYSSCSAAASERLLCCERVGCAKFVHRSCSLRVTEPFRPADESVRVVCGKRCYNALQKQPQENVQPTPAEDAARPSKAKKHGGPGRAKSTDRKKRMPWSCDGPTPEINSLAVLLEWLRVPKNYACWANGGDESQFQTKAALAAHILSLIKAKGVDTDRNPNDVFAKIYQLEKSFAEASGWLRANEMTTEPARLVAGAKKRCTHYYDLADSMGAQLLVKSKDSSDHAVSTITTRKRSARDSDTDSSNTADALKKQMVRTTAAAARELRPRGNVEPQYKEAFETRSKAVEQIATTNKTSEKVSTSIVPVLMNHSFLKASNTSTLAPKKPNADSDYTAHLAALNASFLVASSLVANTTTAPPAPPKIPTPSKTSTVKSSTPADASMTAFNSSLRQTTGSMLRPKPAILGTTAAGLAGMIASKSKQSARSSKSTTPTNSTTSSSSNGSSATSTSIVSASPGTSATPPPMGFSTSMLQVNNSMLQATAEKLQAEAKIATVTANTALLRARKTLREEGVPQAEIDAVLPLARP